MTRTGTSARLAAAALLVLAGAASARPLVIEESQRLAAPHPGWTYLGESVAIDDDWALATALYSPDRSYNYPYQQLALLYRRTGDTWAFDRVLVDDETDRVSWNYHSVALENGLATVSTTPLRAFRRSGTSWTELPQPFSANPAHASWANGLTRIDGSTVASVAGRCRYGAVSNDLIAGEWSAPRLVSGSERTCSLSNYAGSLDVDGNRLAFSNPQEHLESPPSETRIYRRAAPGAAWQLEARLPVAEYGFGLALRGDDLLVGSWNPLGNEVYRRGPDGWTHAGHLPTLAGFSPYYLGAAHFGKEGDLVLVPTASFDGLPAGIAVYRREPGGNYRHVAQLASSRGASLGPVAAISGRQVIVSGWDPNEPDRGQLHFFELPADFATTPLLQDDFEDGNASGWTALSGRFGVTRRGPSLVLRQSSVDDPGAAVLSASTGANQAVEADVRPVAFGSGEQAFGLATRYLDANNYYAAVLRGPGLVELWRVRAGEIVLLGSRPLDVGVGHRYRLRLESIGSRHRVYVNGDRRLDVLDRALDAGRVAVVTSSASAEYDNVLVTPGHRTPLYSIDIQSGSDCEQFTHERLLRQSGTPQWDCSDYEASWLRQASLEGVARAAIGPITGDQAVESRIQLEEFAEGGNADKWLGVMTRYTDEDNYYYFVLRSSKVMSLRKLVNGVITELGRADFTLGSAGWHTMKLEAVGDRLRAYVNGQLLIQAVDSSHPVGISGIATYRSAALFDYLRVVQP